MGKSYQEEIEQNEGLLDTDDEQDLLLDDEGSAGASSTKKKIVPEEEDDSEEDQLEDEEVEVDESDLKPPKKEQSYRKDQVQKIVQTRVGTYSKRIQKLQPYKEAVDKICEVTGLGFDQLVTRLTGMTDAEQAQILGVPVNQVKMARETRKAIVDEQGKSQSLQRQLEETKLKADPKFHDYDLYKEEIDDLLDENPKLSIKQAYLLVKGDSALDVAARDGEQRAIAKRVQAAQTKKIVGTGAASGTAGGPKISPAIVSAAKRIGMDPVEYAKYQSIDNIDAYRASKKKSTK